jgi:hypothetical protein
VTTGSDSSKPSLEVTTGSGEPKAATLVTTGFLPVKASPEQASKRFAGVSEAYREMIELELSRGRNAMGIFQDLVDGHGFTGGYQSIKRLVRKLRGAVSPEARVIIETRPGEEARLITARGRWCAIPTAASTGARGCLF